MNGGRDMAMRPLGGPPKRGIDIAIALCALIVLAPVMVMVAILIYLTMGRPVIFVQDRIGFNRASFRCYKFRTMVVDAEQRLAQYLAENPEAARCWREKQKLDHDHRITRLGYILRKSSLDEMPQLINVLRGDMSCIGPRPIVAAEVERYGASVYDYAKARPGLSGMWQISGRSRRSYAERVALDRYYVRRWSLGLDLIILLKTVPAVLRFHNTA